MLLNGYWRKVDVFETLIHSHRKLWSIRFYYKKNLCNKISQTVQEFIRKGLNVLSLLALQHQLQMLIECVTSINLLKDFFETMFFSSFIVKYNEYTGKYIQYIGWL